MTSISTGLARDSFGQSLSYPLTNANTEWLLQQTGFGIGLLLETHFFTTLGDINARVLNYYIFPRDTYHGCSWSRVAVYRLIKLNVMLLFRLSNTLYLYLHTTTCLILQTGTQNAYQTKRILALYKLWLCKLRNEHYRDRELGTKLSNTEY